MKTDMFIEFAGKKTDSKSLLDTARKIWKDNGNKVKDIESMELFYKPEEGKCYYVFNGATSGSFDV